MSRPTKNLITVNFKVQPTEQEAKRVFDEIRELLVIDAIKGQLEKAPTTGTFHLQLAVYKDKGLNYSHKAMATLKVRYNSPQIDPVKKDNGIEAYVTKKQSRVYGPWEWIKEGHRWPVTQGSNKKD